MKLFRKLFLIITLITSILFSSVNYFNIKNIVVDNKNTNDKMIGVGTTVLFDSSAINDSGAAKFISTNITVANNGNRMLVIAVAAEGQGALSTITVNGSAATFVGSTSSGYTPMYLYYFTNPNVGSNTVYVSASTAYNYVFIVSLYNVKQTSPIGATNYSNSASNGSVTASTNGSFIVGYSSPGRSAVVTGSNQTMVANIDHSAMSYTPTPTTAGGNITFSYTGSSNFFSQFFMAEFLYGAPASGNFNFFFF